MTAQRADPTHPVDTQRERVTLQQHARVIEAMADEEHRRKALAEALSDLLDVIDGEKVEGTCTTGTCHWPAVSRQAFLAREAMAESDVPADTQAMYVHQVEEVSQAILARLERLGAQDLPHGALTIRDMILDALGGPVDAKRVEEIKAREVFGGDVVWLDGEWQTVKAGGTKEGRTELYDRDGLLIFDGIQDELFLRRAALADRPLGRVERDDPKAVVGFVSRDVPANCEAYWCLDCLAPKGPPLGAESVRREDANADMLCDSCGRSLADSPARVERTVWTCMSCGHISEGQSCSACGAECMPGQWRRVEQER